MSDETRTLSFEQTIPATPDAVYHAFTNATALREWLCDVATVAPREGGRCYLAWNDGYYSSGEFKGLAPGERVAFTWHGRGEPGTSSVRVRLTPDGDETGVHIVHDDLGTGDGWAETRSSLERGWSFSLENLESIFSTGADLRFTQRPTLGITVSDFDAAIAERMGVPVNEGICLDSIVPGMGAEAAGLQDGDVVVSIAGKEVVDWASLADALQGHRAGEEVEVVFYRGPQRKQVTMTLSGRPIPEIPQTIGGLTDAVQERYAQINADLSELFAGVTEAQASRKSSSEGWSAREIVAHLIHSERGWHSQMADIVTGHEPWYDDWGGNLQTRIEATLAAYPTTADLLEELRCLHSETVAFVEHLPATFLERKASYWRLAYQLLETPYHHHTHMDQMREAMAAE
ncbi:MAG TPA: SRPBCC domain-containing protein [Candidatus Sulfomarinibacteraceae bacterium]|nr:SRPBCC domain-containing protein [Candidatus Sulfomarinibacteraceae bacterium]